MVSAQDTLAERYGARAPWRRAALVVTVAAVAALFLGWLTWTVWDHSRPQVSSQLETYSVRDTHTATGVLVVQLRDADVQATCLLRAYASDHSVVGELSFRPDPAEGRRQVRDIRTERRATSVESDGCTAPDQTRPR